MGVLLSTLSLALFNASNDAVSLIFAYIYAFISLAVLVYGYVVYQRRITRIRKRDPGHFGMLIHVHLYSMFIYFHYRPDCWPLSHMWGAIFRGPLKFHHQRSAKLLVALFLILTDNFSLMKFVQFEHGKLHSCLRSPAWGSLCSSQALVSFVFMYLQLTMF